jgi:transcriptional regulator with XRE-family HTH domain
VPAVPPLPLAPILGDAIRSLRHERGVSQEDLASAAGIHTTYLSGIERGHRNPSWNVVVSLAAALDIETSALAQRVEAAVAGADDDG